MFFFGVTPDPERTPILSVVSDSYEDVPSTSKQIPSQYETFPSEGSKELPNLAEKALNDDSVTVEILNNPSFGRARKASIYLILAVSNVFLGACFSLLAPFFPEEGRKKEISSLEQSFVFGIFQLALLVSSILWGKTTAFKPQCRVILGLFLAGSSSILFGILDYSPHGTTFFVLAFLMRITEAAGAAAIRTSTAAIMAFMASGGLGWVVSLVQGSYCFGLLIGPVLGEILYGVYGFMLPFLALGSLMLIWVPIAFFVIPSVEPPAQTQSAGGFLTLLKNPGVLVDMLMVLTSYMGFGFNHFTLADHLEQFHQPSIIVGLVFGVLPLSCVSSSPVWGYLGNKKVSLHLMRSVASILLIIAYLLTGPAFFIPMNPQLWLVILSLIMQAIGAMGKIVSSNMDILETARVDLYGNVAAFQTGQGLCSSSNAMGGFIGPILGGLLTGVMDYRHASSIVAFIECAVLGIGVFYATYQMCCDCRRWRDVPRGQEIDYHVDDPAV